MNIKSKKCGNGNLHDSHDWGPGNSWYYCDGVRNPVVDSYLPMEDLPPSLQRKPRPHKQEEGSDGKLLFLPPLSFPTATRGPVEEPVFQEHECWLRLEVWQDKTHPNEPGEVVCKGCGRRWGLVEEFRQ
jgi:hypothetical protein